MMQRPKARTTEYWRWEYHKKVNRLREKIKEIFGEKCQKCGSTNKLQLHHKYYASDSIRPRNSEPGYVSLSRKKEAIEHPERFVLLCITCHNKIEPRPRKSRNQSNLKLREAINCR